jgi:hypothetical protein
MPGRHPNNPLAGAARQEQQRVHRHMQQFQAQMQQNLQNQWQQGVIARHAQHEARQREQAAAGNGGAGSGTTYQNPDEISPRGWVAAAIVALVVAGLGGGLFLAISLLGGPGPGRAPRPTPVIASRSHTAAPYSPPSPTPAPRRSASAPRSSAPWTTGPTSSTPAMSPVPDVVGLSPQAAEATLEEAGFSATVAQFPGTPTSGGTVTVIKQSPTAGTQAPAKAPVTLYIGVTGGTQSPTPPTGTPTSAPPTSTTTSSATATPVSTP